MEDASEGIHAIRQAVRNAREHDPLYSFGENVDAARWSEMTGAGDDSAAAQHLRAEAEGESEHSPSSRTNAEAVEGERMAFRFDPAKPPEPPVSWDS